MARRLYAIAAETLVMEDVPDGKLEGNQVRMKNTFCSVKHGTDFSNFSGKSPFAEKVFDQDLRMFMDKPVGEAAVFSKTPFGNAIIGRIIETGLEVESFAIGDRVLSYGAVSDIHVTDESTLRRLPPTITDYDAACLDPATCAMAAIRDADARIGDSVVVFGLGAIGLMTVQLLRVSGCLGVIAVDPIEKRRALAVKFGATLAIDPTACDAALEIHKHLGCGCDIAIEASGSYKALRQAMRSVRQCGSITTIGYYKGKDAELALGEEWMHNRLTMKCSLPAWGNPMRDYPAWDGQRAWSTVMQMFSKGKITSAGVIDPLLSFEDSVAGIMNVYRNQDTAIKIGIECNR